MCVCVYVCASAAFKKFPEKRIVSPTPIYS